MIFLIILLVRSLSMGGFNALDIFEIEDFADINLWAFVGKSALSDSLLLTGVMMSLASFQQYGKSKKGLNTVLIVTALLLIQIMSYLFVFEILSHSHYFDSNQTFSTREVTFGLIPQVLETMDLPQLWTSLFFLMLFLFELGTTMALTETILSAVEDLRTNIRTKRLISAATVVILTFALSLPFFSNRGSDLIAGCEKYLEPHLTEAFTISWVS